MKRGWQERRRAEVKPVDRPNLVFSTTAHVRPCKCEAGRDAEGLC